MKKIGILTSSRADYGIYQPLLRLLRDHPYFDPKMIVFGTHLSPFHGYTSKEIEADGFSIDHTINSILLNDEPDGIATSAALTSLAFTSFWKEHGHSFDLLLALGDRYEMFAAVTSSIPFGVPIAHIHAGETTLGAIDNIYRHAITLSSNICFTSTEAYSKRVEEIRGSKEGIITTGALALDHLKTMDFLSRDAFLNRWGIDLSEPSILLTVHPETVNPEQNHLHVKELKRWLEGQLSQLNVIVTMPNSDTLGNSYRTLFQDLKREWPEELTLIENFGTLSYFTCMKEAKLIAGNSSSGIIEAASFGKYVINMGERQKGRICGENVVHVPFSAIRIREEVEALLKKGDYKGTNPYDYGGAGTKIISALENYFTL